MPTVDVHTHVYPPSYISLLRSRTTVPYIRNFPDAPDSARLIILPGEDAPTAPGTARGRPIGPEYSSIAHKLAFMDAHGITASVISLANPWLDFLAPDDAAAAASAINDEIDALCAAHPKRLFHFATLPLSASAEAVAAEVARLASPAVPHCRGVIMGTSGLGRGLDDPALEPVWAALEEAGLIVFLHPHYGLPGNVYGPLAGEYGHVLPLAIGFPVETTIAVARMLLAGVWERHGRLEVLLAHSGGTLPFLAGRIESCVAHDGHLKKEGRTERMRSLWEVLKKNIYLDAVVYSEVGLRAAVEASGKDRIMFGTDHPFFPPLDGEETEWLSVKTNYSAIKQAFNGDESAAEAVLGGNAARILKLDL
ncbi:2-amino-3-carboxymuconate-6-semialdehyde decarboxylase [Lasiodiplodia hormozganensis]|uniref:2-amino-3-carboxymuconate-6-semialdehyde decarboxylase n=1 Tax=Lasiodiplodia hormozganensis TaxID=869390 RepID=A0AA39U259_9PEZI|nr:2-amino-3-carboxymuconate-6-semialdehyde decarboxylase [Lasiodiplodia hormozganensis]